MGIVDLRAPVKQIRHFPPLMPVMSQDLARHQGVPQLQTTSADLWTFLLKALSPFSIRFFNLA
jgi:hypothetical protein